MLFRSVVHIPTGTQIYIAKRKNAIMTFSMSIDSLNQYKFGNTDPSADEKCYWSGRSVYGPYLGNINPKDSSLILVPLVFSIRYKKLITEFLSSNCFLASILMDLHGKKYSSDLDPDATISIEEFEIVETNSIEVINNKTWKLLT